MKTVNEKKVNKICNVMKEMEERVRNPEAIRQTLTSEKRMQRELSVLLTLCDN